MSLRPGGVEVENALGGEISDIFGTAPRGTLASNVMVLPIAWKRFRGATRSTPKKCNGRNRGGYHCSATCTRVVFNFRKIYGIRATCERS